MKLIVLYGPGEVGKRGYLLKLKQSFPSESVETLDFKQTSVSHLSTTIVSGSLFVSSRVLVIENITDQFDCSLLPETADPVTVVLVAADASPKSSLFISAQAKKAQMIPFEGEKEINAFPFLDAVIERRSEAFVEAQTLLDSFGVYYILTMLYYLLRRNLLPPPASSYAQQKIGAQKKGVSQSQFAKLYKLVLTTEYQLKSGQVDQERTVLFSLIEQIQQELGSSSRG